MAQIVKKEVEGGNDGVAQIRSDAGTHGTKLTDLVDGTPLLVDLSTLHDGWCKVTDLEGKPFWLSPNGNWIEMNNVREPKVIPVPPVPEDGWKEINLKFENGRIYWKEA